MSFRKQREGGGKQKQVASESIACDNLVPNVFISRCSSPLFCCGVEWPSQTGHDGRTRSSSARDKKSLDRQPSGGERRLQPATRGPKKNGFCHCAFLQNLLKTTVQISRILQVFSFFFFLVCMVLARHPKWFSGGDLSPAEDEASDRVFVGALAAQMEARFTYTSVIVA